MYAQQPTERHIIIISLLLCIAYFIGITETVPNSKLRLTKLRKPDCSNSFPKRSEDLSQVVLHGIVDEVYMTDNGADYKASVNVTRVMKGYDSLEGTTIIVTGFNSSALSGSQVCPSNVKPKDTMIYLLDQIGDKIFSLNTTIISMNLNNLDKINALALKEPFKRRGPIIETLCETQYCPFNADCIELDNEAKCVCPVNCESSLKFPEVCGSNNKTYR